MLRDAGLSTNGSERLGIEQFCAIMPEPGFVTHSAAGHHPDARRVAQAAWRPRVATAACDCLAYHLKAFVTKPTYVNGMHANDTSRRYRGDAFQAPCDAAALWRGRFITEFALAETVVSEALAFLAEVAIQGARSLLPHLIGQRFAALKAVVDRNGPFSQEGVRVAKAIEEFTDLHRLRSFLCHGAGIVTIDHHGHWIIALDLLTFRGAEIHRDAMTLHQDEARVMLDQLHGARLRLDGQLRGMLATFTR
ncbi:hypothetical protein [Sphingomonas faeni]|uniref:hypothetical protein n=1 Tax=Sphingomonas faeni TaxID=185950 RepID=UPI0033556103